MWTLLSATPSPYARKIRIALLEKDLPFTLQTEVPWDTTTATPAFNPLEKLPVLILDPKNPDTAVYESHYILEWLEAKYPQSSLLPEGVEDRLFAKKVEVVADGVADALVLAFWEGRREEGMRSQAWTDRERLMEILLDRQMRKAAGGLQAMSTWVDQAGGKEFLIGDKLTIADIAIVSTLGWLRCRWPEQGWEKKHPGLEKYFQRLDQRKNFAQTRPYAQTVKDQVV